MKKVFLIIVFLGLTALYAFQLYSEKKVKEAAAAKAAAALPKAAAPLDPAARAAAEAAEKARQKALLDTKRVAAEAGLKKLKITTILLGASPMAQIDGQTYSLTDSIKIPDTGENATVREIKDGQVVFNTPYHPQGYGVGLSTEKLKSTPTN